MKSALALFRSLARPGGGAWAIILKGSLGSAGIKAIYVFVQFASGVFLARMLGPEALGRYAFTMALVQVLVIGTQFGFPDFLVRSIAVNHARNAGGEIKGLIVGAGQIVLIFSLTLVATGLLWLLIIKPEHGIASQSTLMVGLFLVIPLALTATTSGAIRGLGNVIVSLIPNEVVRPVILLLVLAIFYISGITLTPERALLAHGFAALMGFSIAAVVLLRLLPDQVLRSVANTQRGRLLWQSLPFCLLAGAQVLNGQTDILMLGLLSTKDQVGLYRVALQVSVAIGIVIFAISVSIAPQIARLHARGEWKHIQKILVYGHRGGTLAIMPIALVFVLFGGPILALVFGEVYRPASGALSVLAIGTAAYALVGFSGLALSMLGQPGVATIIALTTIALNVALNLLLIPRYGIEGAALATASSQFVVALLGILYLWHKTTYDFSAFGKIK